MAAVVPPVVPYVQELAEAQKATLAKLCELDDEYLKRADAMRAELRAVEQKFAAEVAPLLAERGGKTKELPHFWLRALQHSHCAELIEDHDEPCLEALANITCETKADPTKGFKLHFHFAANEFFANAVLTKTYHTEPESKWDADLDTTKIEVTPVEWKDGMDLTVELVTKGKGKKKKVKKVPRDSFFRFFYPLGEGAEFPPEVPGDSDDEDESEEEDEEEKMADLINEDMAYADALRNLIIPHAVRHYTQEAVEMESDDESDGEPNEEESDSDEPQFETPQKQKAPAAKAAAKGRT
jgi:nucleosome assembly protein 1-like 1